MAYSHEPDWFVSTGEVLKETLEALKISQLEFARRAGLSVEVVDRIIIGEEPVNKQIALKLEKATNISFDFWVNLESNYRIMENIK